MSATPRPPIPPEILDSHHKVFTLDGTGGDKEGYPILVKRHADQQPTFRHEHVYHEMVLVESGTADHLSAEGKRRLVVGDILIIKPRIWHRYAETRHFGIVNCLFDRRIFVHQKVFLSLASGAFDLFQKPVRHPATTPPTILHASPAQREPITQLLNMMIRERQEKQVDWQGALIGSLLNLIVAVSRIHHGVRQEHDPAGEEKRDFVNRILVDLEERFREKITLDDLSRRFHASPSHLSRLFSQRMGMGIVDYINHLRIEAACHLLQNTDWPASRIATEVGYEEIPYFFRRFKREIGKSPLDYRNSKAT